MDDRNSLKKTALGFTDIYIDRSSPERSYTYNQRGNIYKKYDEYTNEEQSFLKEFFTYSLMKIDDESADGIKKDHLIKWADRSFRAYQIPAISGTVVAMRQMPPKFINLEETGLNKRIMEELLHRRLSRGGLVIICGAPGNGKTTTCAAMIDARLKMYGGLCITIEDPVEIELKNDWGSKGKCLQIQVRDKSEFPEAVRGIMRAYPTGVDSMMLIGETRDPETASEALRSSMDGRLVITTMHSDNPASALERFYTYASKILDQDDVSSMLSSSFRLCIHQTLNKGQLSPTILVDEVEVRGILKNQKFGSLKTNIEHQNKAIELDKPFQYSNRRFD